MLQVGYGHISPGTTNGKIFCILYSLIGIPLLLVFMTQVLQSKITFDLYWEMFSCKIGDWMAVTFRWLYSRILCRWCRARRRDAELPPGVDRRSKGLAFDEIGKERYMPTDLVMVPITVNLILIFSFIFVGALAFASWEDWDPIASAYFCFITLTTIGYIIYTLSTHHIPLILISTNRFGDLYPQKAFLGFREDPIALMKMCFTVAYCIFGKQSYEDWKIG